VSAIELPEPDVAVVAELIEERCGILAVVKEQFDKA
jgi:hypothetical protein